MEWDPIILESSRLLLAENPPPLELRRTLNGLKDWLLRFSRFDPRQEENRKDLYLPTGKALGPTWAANCLVDIMRTQQFVRGVRAAIEHHLAAGRRPVRILYAGSGPFATLVLPLLPHYTAAALQITLLEINPVTQRTVSQLVETLRLQSHIGNIHQVDAATYRIPEDDPPDILLTESMQAGMHSEQQVAIFANLDAQAPAHATWVPESIDLTLALCRSAPDPDTTEIHQNEWKRLDTLMTFNRREMADWRHDHGQSVLSRLFPGELRLEANHWNGYSQLGILTDICTFGDYWLRKGNSSLNTPLIIEDLRRFSPTSLIFKYWYEVSNSPGLRFNIVEAKREYVNH